jgi:glycosyltransferase involved in cell wall biosynthesis
MPALDEADALPAALAGRPRGLKVLVVDNGSTDGTADVARQLGAEVVTERRRGFGQACLSGARAVPPGSTVAFVDADATFAWPDIVALGEMVDQGEADLALSWRRRDLREPGAMPWQIATANFVVSTLAGAAAGVRLHDLGPLRAIGREQLLGLGLVDRTYGWPLEMVLVAAQRGLRIRERPVIYQVRAGRSKVTGRLGPTLRTVGRMLAILARATFHRAAGIRRR